MPAQNYCPVKWKPLFTPPLRDHAKVLGWGLSPSVRPIFYPLCLECHAAVHSAGRKIKRKMELTLVTA
jgi:hypothetical protein